MIYTFTVKHMPNMLPN